MKILSGFLNFIRFVLAFALFVFLFIMAERYSAVLLAGDKYTAMKIAGRFLLLEGLGGFISMFLALALVNRRTRVINGALLLFIMLALYCVFYVPPLLGSGHWMSYLMALVGISFVSFGMCGGIMLWGNIPTPFKFKPKLPKPGDNKKMPEISKLATLLGMVSVPAAYVTIAFSSFITLGISLWLLFLILQMPRIPVVLLVGVGITPLVAIWGTFLAIKAIFGTGLYFQPAVRIDTAGKTRLKKAISEICAAVGTKEPDNVLLHAEPTFFVSQAPMKCYDTEVKGRSLAIGAPLVKELSETELKAILAHEFAHFSGNDTAYSLYVAPAYGSLNTALGQMNAGVESNIQAVATILLLIPKMFISMFLTYFATIDKLISRSREYRADWIAASKFGRPAAASALEKVMCISGHFYDHGAAAGYDNPNYFAAYSKLAANEAEKLDEYGKKAMEEQEHEFDSHPVLAARLAAMPQGPAHVAGMESGNIVNELSADEERLSGFFQDHMKAVKQANEKTNFLNEVYDRLNAAQSDLIHVIAAAHEKLKREKSANMDWLKSCLLIGQEPDSSVKGKVKKMIGMLKEDKEKFDLLMKGTALRLKIYMEGGLEDAAEQIKKRYTLLGILEPLPEAPGNDLSAVEAYEAEVKGTAGSA